MLSVRNPFNIKEALSLLICFHPTDPQLYQTYLRVAKSNSGERLLHGCADHDNASCLLSGLRLLSDDDDVHQAWCFNLDSNSFVTYSFSEIDQFYFNHKGPKPYIPYGGREQLLLNEEPLLSDITMMN